MAVFNSNHVAPDVALGVPALLLPERRTMQSLQTESADEALTEPDASKSSTRHDERLLKDLLDASLVLAEDWDRLSEASRHALYSSHHPNELLSSLIEQGLLTQFQANRISSGRRFGLILGNYRILDRLGTGGMSEVFKAEHIELRKFVAIKAIEILDLHDPVYLRRFIAEMRIIAQLKHPNIVCATDAGRCKETGPDGQTLWYFVMDYVPGENLEHLVKDGEPLDAATTCNIIHQIASALAEANKRNLVHRDIKPSNIILTPDSQAKLLDFGLARDLLSRETRRGALLGTVQYMSPEQASDSSSVDIRSDIYSLGATMYWCLTGLRPFPERRGVMRALAERQSGPIPSARQAREEIPEELDAVLMKMMSPNPNDRIQTPQEVMQALEAFLQPELRQKLAKKPRPHSVSDLLLQLPDVSPVPARRHRVLIVDSDLEAQKSLVNVLQSDSLNCDVAKDGFQALAMTKTRNFDAILLNLELPGMTGPELGRRLRDNVTGSHLKLIILTRPPMSDDAAALMAEWADEYVVVPASDAQLRARVQAALRRKDQQDDADRLNKHLLSNNRHNKSRALIAEDSDDSADWLNV